MKFECEHVSLHNKLVACGFAVLNAASAYQVGHHYGWNGSHPGLTDNFAVVFSVVGFAVALFCVLAVPLNRVAWARLASCAVFTSYGYLAWADKIDSGWALFYGIAAVAAGWRLIEAGLEKELKQL